MIFAVGTHSFRSRDGRQISYEEFGGTPGFPILYFHGSPGSRIDASTLGSDQTLAGLAHVIAADRPGYGHSTPVADSTPESIVADTEALANHLALDRFAVCGADQGGLYALSCAALLPDRVTSVALLGGLPEPLDEPLGAHATASGGFRQALGDRLLGLLLAIVPAFGHAAPGTYMRLGVRTLPRADREVLRSPGLRSTLLASIKEQYRQRSVGLRSEIYHRLGGFDLANVQAPVFIWHGEQNRTPPLAANHELAQQLPNATVIECPGEGRLVGLRHAHEIIQALSIG